VIMNEWQARLRSVTFPGGVSNSPAQGVTLYLRMRLVDAGKTHTGRDVEVVIAEDELDIVESLVAHAMRKRDERARKGNDHGC